MELVLDIFRNDAFSVTSLKRTVTNTPFIPTMLGTMNLFDPEPIYTTEVLLYEEDGNIRLIPTTERGAPDIRQVRDPGRIRALSTVRLSKADQVKASELANIANEALPQDVRLRNAVDLVNKRTAILKQDMAATKELHRLGAIQGKLLDADGTTVLVDYFAQYGIATPATINVDFSTIAEQDLLAYVQNNIYRPMTLTLQNRATPGGFRIGALVGDTFWDRLMRNPGFRNIWIYMQQAQALARAANPLVQPNAWTEVEFGGVTWINYRGSTAGDIAIPVNDAVFFPIGATDVFSVFWSPGETMKDAGQLGEPEYLYVEPDPRPVLGDHVNIVLRSYPLYACIYPKCLIRMHSTG